MVSARVLFAVLLFYGFQSMSCSDESLAGKKDVFKNTMPNRHHRSIIAKESSNEVHSRPRRRSSNKVKINFINKAGRSVKVYVALTFGYQAFLRHQFNLRPNEPRGIDVSPGSLWVVRDLETGVNMLINGKIRYFVRARQGRHDFLDLKIRNPPFLKRKLIDGNFPPVSEKYLKVMLVADSSVTNHHGREKVKKYILTIMNIVSKIFKDKSLGINVNIIITKIHIMQTDPASYKIVENDPDASINNACKFASSLKKEKRESDHNFVVVLTRKAIGPSGYAAMYTMCTKQSCTLVKESGFATAYVIAHETGHALGIDHDGEDKECEKDKLKGSIMAPKVYSKHEKYHWSTCSRRALYENIRYFSCLDKKPSDQEANEMNYFSDMPGEMFSKPEQCRHRLGKQASACYVFYGACTFLWCRLGFWAPCRALITSSPLEGTFCGTHKWCMKGHCVSNKGQPVDGRWSAWTEFGSCEGFCGAGIRIRRRKCTNPKPRNGGRACFGKDHELKSCTLKKCASMEEKAAERHKKCGSIGKEWAYYDAKAIARKIKEAKISCNFENGPCGWKDGVDERLDWLLHSGPTRSSGTGPPNDHTFGNSRGHYVYFEASWVKAELRPVPGDSAKIFSLPIIAPTICLSFYYHLYGIHLGSLKVFTTSASKPMNVVWSRTGSQGDQWKKAELTIKHNSSYQIVFEAVRGGGYRGDVALDDIEARIGSCTERDDINPCTGHCFSTDRDATRQIKIDNGTPCYSNESLDVCYEGKCQKIGCDFELGSTNQVDECGICGGDGSTCKVVKTKKTVTADKTLREVFVIPEGSENVTVTLPSHPWIFGGVYMDDSNATNVFNTDGNRWPTGNYSVKKNTFLYERNEKRETITIVKLVNQGCRIVVFNPFAKELSISQPKAQVSLDVKLPLSKGYSNFQYGVKSWSACSKSCGGGVQHPILVCVEKKSERQLTDLYCNDIIPPDVALSRACNIGKCNQAYEWSTGQWSPCSTSCGLGQQTREVKCLDKRLRVYVDNNACRSSQPIRSKSCYIGACTGHRIITDTWSSCSKNCGLGYQWRRVTCAVKNHEHKALSDLPLADCLGGFPISARPCHAKPCKTFHWVSYNFGRCSATCGGGIQIKMISCRHTKTGITVFNFLCPKPRPFFIDDCNTFPC